jgi:hypothetical protein
MRRLRRFVVNIQVVAIFQNSRPDPGLLLRGNPDETDSAEFTRGGDRIIEHRDILLIENPSIKKSSKGYRYRYVQTVQRRRVSTYLYRILMKLEPFTEEVA